MTKKICFISPWVYSYFNPSVDFNAGGAERQIHLLSNALSEQFDVHVIVGDFGQARTETVSDVTLHRAFSKQEQYVSNPIKPVWKLFNAMKRANADIYIDRNSPRMTAVSYFLTRILRKKFVYHIANDANLTRRPENYSRPIERLFYRAVKNSDTIIAQSEKQKNTVKSMTMADIHVIPNCYPSIENPATYNNRESILWVGKLRKEHKRPHLFLDLAELLPSVDFKLIGRIDTNNKYHCHIRNRAKEIPNLTLTGWISPDKIHDEFRKAIALVSTSAYEGFPNVFLEAWRQGTPVISLSIDPFKYINVPFGYGNDDLQRVEKLIAILVGNTNLRQFFGEELRRSFENNFDVQSIGGLYANALNNI